MRQAVFTLSVVAICLVAARADAQAPNRLGGTAIPPVSQDMARAPEGRGQADRGPATTGSLLSTGRAKPPGAALGAPDDRQSELDRRQEAIDRRVRAGICRGC